MKDVYFLMRPELIRATIAGKKWQTRRILKSVAGRGPLTEVQASTTPGYDIIARDRRALWNDFTVADLKGRSPYGKLGDLAIVREAWKYSGWTEEGFPWIEYGTDGEKRLITEIPSEWSDRLLDAWIALSSAETTSTGGKAADRHWRSPLHFPRWAARIVRPITEIKVERVQDISEADAIAEGVGYGSGDKSSARASAMAEQMRSRTGDYGCDGLTTAQCLYRLLWNEINLTPKPRYGRLDGKRVITHYEAFPWSLEDFDGLYPGAWSRGGTGTWKGKPLTVYPNPWVWCISYERREEAPHA